MRRFNFLGMACLALTSASLACQSLDDLDAQVFGTQVPTLAPTASPAPVPIEYPTRTPQGVGLMCAGTSTGLSCLTEAGWQTYTQDNSDLPNDYLYAGAVCPDGRLVLAHAQGFSWFDGKTWEHVGRHEDFSSPEGVACGAQDDLWVTHFKGVSHYIDGEWTTYGSENLGTGESASELVYDVAIAPDGKVWVVSARSVALFEDGAWQVFQEGQGFSDSRFFNALTLDALGRPWAAHSNGVDVWQAGEWLTLKALDYTSPESVALDAAGQVWLGTLSDGARRFSGRAWTTYDRAKEYLGSNHVRALATDSSGRVWVGTTYGLSVFANDEWQTYLMHNSDIGDNDIRFILLTQDGPALPPLAEKPLGSISGQLENADHQPLANKRVEACVEIFGFSFSGDTPCEGQPYVLMTKTDAMGKFVFEEVPAGYYVIVGETDTGWAQFTDEFGIAAERQLLLPGEEYDLGTLTVEEDE